MGFVLPVPPPVQWADQYAETASDWEQAAPPADALPMLGYGGGPVTRSRTGPGDVPQSRDEWMGIDIYDIGHNGVENGEQLFIGIPDPPPEGHKGYDFPDTDQIQDRSTSRQALFWSDWQASVPAHAFTGEHVVISRIPPGSTQGYQPTDMTQLNVDRNAPSTPWDAPMTIGANMLAATSGG